MYTLRVLIVDDEPGMRHGIERALEHFTMKLPDVEDGINFSLVTAETGKEALEKINSEELDLILLDYKLPDLTGLEILEHIESNEGTTLTLMITAYASLETAVSAIKSGAFDFLSKPFTPEELRSKIAKASQSIILAKHVKKLNEEKRQLRFQFISVLGHELKAPLAAVEGYLYMLNDKSLGTDLAKYDECVQRCLIRTEQMRKLIIDLLEMTKIESGNRQRELAEISLKEIVLMSVETFTPEALKRNISIKINCEDSLSMLADRTELEIIFNNLVSNAVKYNRDEGRVTVNIIKENQNIIIKVADTGIGMTKEETDKLFQEFVRIRNKKTKDILGTGLGLSTIRKIAHLYKGDISVTSRPDEGTEFTICLEKVESEKVVSQQSLVESI